MSECAAELTCLNRKQDKRGVVSRVCAVYYPTVQHSVKLVCDVINIKLDSLYTVQFSEVVTNESLFSGCYFNIK